MRKIIHKCVLLIVYYDVGYYNIGFIRVQNNWKCVLLIVYYDIGYYKIYVLLECKIVENVFY